MLTPHVAACGFLRGLYSIYSSVQCTSFVSILFFFKNVSHGTDLVALSLTMQCDMLIS